MGTNEKKGIFRLNIRKKFAPVRVLRHWSRLPRVVVAVPILAVQVGQGLEQPGLVGKFPACGRGNWD